MHFKIFGKTDRDQHTCKSHSDDVGDREISGGDVKYIERGIRQENKGRQSNEGNRSLFENLKVVVKETR